MADAEGLPPTIALRANYKVVDTLVHDYQAAIAAVGGVGSGTLASLGAWSLVGTFGTASTGTAISTLGGAALTNASLAWFGGGSIAAGGGGMALGGIVLGGIVLVPAAVLGVWKLNSCVTNEIQQVNSTVAAMKKELVLVNRSAATYREAIPRIRDVEISIHEVHGQYVDVWNTFREAVLVFPLASYAYRWCRAKLGLQVFNSSEVILIESVIQGAESLATAMQQLVFDQTGTLRTDPLIQTRGVRACSPDDYGDRLRWRARSTFGLGLRRFIRWIAGIGLWRSLFLMLLTLWIIFQMLKT